jgi:hypothetical protein
MTGGERILLAWVAGVCVANTVAIILMLAGVWAS